MDGYCLGLPPAIHYEQLGQVPQVRVDDGVFVLGQGRRPDTADSSQIERRSWDRTAGQIRLTPAKSNGAISFQGLYLPVHRSTRKSMAGTEAPWDSRVLPEWLQRRTVGAKPVAITLDSPPATDRTTSRCSASPPAPDKGTGRCSSSTPAICLPSSEIAGRKRYPLAPRGAGALPSSFCTNKRQGPPARLPPTRSRWSPALIRAEA